MSCSAETTNPDLTEPDFGPGGSDLDKAFMAHAATLALRGKGDTAPNPCVGAVLVRNGAVAAEGWHKACGQPHAEPEALADARERGVDPSECSMYVTLEPCNHHGRTPPCTEAILEAGIKRVVVGAVDPNPDVAGGGAAYLREHGVEVITGVLEDVCLDIIDDFITWKYTKRTYNTLKMAATLDGKIAARHGKPEPVSSPESLAKVHGMRAAVDAVIVGGGTFRADNPSLTCRMDDLPEHFRQPFAVVVATTLPNPDEEFVLLRKRPEQTIFWTTERTAGAEAARDLEALGCKVWGLPTVGQKKGSPLDLAAGFERLRTELGCWRTLCEGGGGLAASLAVQGLIDEFTLFLAPRILGDDQGKSLFSGRNAESMSETLGMRIIDVVQCGPDLQLTLKPTRR